MASCSNKSSSSAGHSGLGGGVGSLQVLQSNGHSTGMEKMPNASEGKSQNAAMSGPEHTSGSNLPLQVGVEVVVVPVAVVSVAVVAVVVVVVVVAVPVDVRVVMVAVVVATQLLHMTGHPWFTATMSHRSAPSSTQLTGSNSSLQYGEAVVVVVVAVVVVWQESQSTGQPARNEAPLIGFVHTAESLPLHKGAGSGCPPQVAVNVVVVGMQEPHMSGQFARTPAPT